jgi:hypothetical protein
MSDELKKRSWGWIWWPAILTPALYVAVCFPQPGFMNG